jgi:hypothetical protein
VRDGYIFLDAKGRWKQEPDMPTIDDVLPQNPEVL